MWLFKNNPTYHKLAEILNNVFAKEHYFTILTSWIATSEAFEALKQLKTKFSLLMTKTILFVLLIQEIGKLSLNIK